MHDVVDVTAQRLSPELRAVLVMSKKRLLSGNSHHAFAFLSWSAHAKGRS